MALLPSEVGFVAGVEMLREFCVSTNKAAIDKDHWHRFVMARHELLHNFVVGISVIVWFAYVLVIDLVVLEQLLGALAKGAPGAPVGHVLGR